MSGENLALSRNPSQESLVDLIVDCIQDIKGINIVKLDLRALDEAPTDFFVICEGESTTQVRAIANNIQKRLRLEIDNKANHVEGVRESRWILLDYFEIIVHVFYPETRAYYEIEDLWSDAKITEYQNL